MSRALAIATALLLPIACAPLTPQQPAPPITQDAEFRFAKRCLDFYEGVHDLSVQKAIGGISESQAEALDPFIETGNVICQDDDIVDFNGALTDLETIVEGIATAQQENGE